MEFRILGPVLVLTGDGRHQPFGPRQTNVLAALLLAANEVVPVHQLIDAVWDDSPPATARRQIHNCVWALRKQLTILADGPGYRIRVGDGQLDAQRFADLVAEAQTLAANGNAARAADRLAAALRLWRGPALADCVSRTIQASAARLNEQRLAAIEQRLDLQLQLDRHEDVIGELTELVATHPLRERLVGQLMRALYASGRQADALAAYQQLRARLADDLGVDPGAELRELYTALLRNEVEDRRAQIPSMTGIPGLTGAPRQLPAPVRHFVGRTTELRQLTGLVDETAAPGGTVVISAIGGTAGIGKTTIAVHWAHQVASRYPDGQLYVNLRGFDTTGSPMQPAEAIRGFLDAFGVPAERIPRGLDAQAGLYRSLLASRRVLLVLDNARDADQVHPLLPGCGTCLVIVTSRNRLTGLVAAEGAHPVTLDLLTMGEGRDLLAHHLGGERTAREPAAVDGLVDRCAHLPLALSIVAARAATYPKFPLATFAAELADAQCRLDALDGGDDMSRIRGVFSWSYQALTPAAARMFRLLGEFPGPDFTVPAAASLVGLPVDQVRPLLAELTRAHLVSEHLPGRYTFHDLLRTYAAELAGNLDSADERRAALHRVLDHHLHTGWTADRLLAPTREPITLDPATAGVAAQGIADHAQAMAWFTAEHRGVQAAAERAANGGFATHTWKLAWALATFLHRQGRLHDLLSLQSRALTAARDTADRTGQANAHRYLARTYSHLGRHGAAGTHARGALEMFRQLDNPRGRGDAHLTMAEVLAADDRHEAALDHLHEALTLFEDAGFPAGRADVLNSIGWCHAHLGDHQKALVYCDQAVALHREIGNPRGEAAAWDSLGYAYRHLDDHGRATACYERAIDLYRRAADRVGEANAFVSLGDTHDAAGNRAGAVDAWRQAVDILGQLHHPDADRIHAKIGTRGHGGRA